MHQAFSVGIPRLGSLVALAFVSIAALGSCSKGGSGSGGVQIRNGVVKVYAGQKANNPACQHANDFCPTFEGIFVADFPRDDKTWAIVRNTEDGINYMIDASLDQGATWTFHRLQPSQLELVPTPGGLRAFAVDGNVFMTLTKEYYASGSNNLYWHPFAVDLATNRISDVDPDPAARGLYTDYGPLVFRDGKIRSVEQIYDPRGAGSRFPGYGELDLRTDRGTGVTIPCNGVDCDAYPFVTTDDGTSWSGFSLGQTQTCRLSWATDPNLGSQGTKCVASADYPANAHDGGSQVETRAWFGMPWQMYNRGGHVWATTIDWGGKVRGPLDLGPGHLEGGETADPRWGNWLLIKGGADVPGLAMQPGRFVRVGMNDQPEELVVRQTPCVDDSDCGYTGGPYYGARELVWLAADKPLQNGTIDAVALYVVQSESNDNQQTLYFSHEQATVKPIVPGPGTPPPSPLGAYPSATPMNDFEKACVRALSCFSHPPVTGNGDGNVLSCVQFLSQEYSQRPAVAQARDLLVSSSASCEAIAAVWPELASSGQGCGLGCTAQSGTCSPTGTCSLGDPSKMSMCGTCDSNGHAWDCSYGQGARDLDCGANGYTCNGGFCTLDRCAAGQSASGCDGDTYIACSSTTVSRLRCDLLGGHCNTNPVSVQGGLLCADPTPSESSCNSMQFNPTCDGKYMIACFGGHVQYVDCSSIGFTTCGPGNGQWAGVVCK